MEEYPIVSADHNHQAEPRTFWHSVLLFFQGFVSPCGSLKYYREISQKPLVFAIGFFAVFGLFVAVWTTVTLSMTMGSLTEEARNAYESGKIPTIVIKDGLATVEGPQPIVYTENRQFFGIDTRGTITEIDTREYSEGMLLTRNELHILNEDGYQRLALRDLNSTFGNPIVIDQENVLRWIGVFTSFFMLLVFFGMFLGYTFFWFMIILLIGLVFWGIVTIKRKAVGFSPVLAIGLFAFVPATYLDFVLNKLGLQFCGLQILLLILIWGLVMRSVLNRLYPLSEAAAFPGLDA